MADILIDNATVSSALRALGFVRCPRRDLLDVEQAALERLTEAMLLGDAVVIPDNYQEEFRQRRKDILNHACFRHIPIAEDDTGSLDVISTAMCKLWSDAYEQGATTGSLARYFEFADSYFKHVWRGTKDSIYYIVQGYFGIGKTNPLIETFLQKDYGDYASKVFGDFSYELESGLVDVDRELDDDSDPRDFDDNGVETVVRAEDITGQLTRLISTLAWLGKQYIWHQTLASARGATYLPHPLREFFAADFLGSIEQKPPGAKHGGVVREGLRKFSADAQQSLEEIGLGSSLVTLDVPTFLPLATRLSSSGTDFLDTVHQLRSERDCVELRHMLTEIASGLDEGNVTPYRKLRREIETIGKNILRERGIEIAQLRVSPPWQLLGVTPPDTTIDGTDATSIGFDIPRVLYKQFFVRKRYRTVLKSVMDELAFLPTLGGYKDKLNRYAMIGYPS
jgi:hypothetical protein